MRSVIKPLTAAALSATWLVSLPASGQSQTQNQTENQTRGQSASPTIPAQKLDAAAAAIQHVDNIQQTYQQQMETAKPAEKQRITSEATTAVKKAITDQGLSVEEYQSILKVAENDPTVRQQLVQRIKPSGP